jgi:hypothetical protein
MGNMLRPPSFWRKDDHVERAGLKGLRSSVSLKLLGNTFPSISVAIQGDIFPPMKKLEVRMIGFPHNHIAYGCATGLIPMRSMCMCVQEFWPVMA